MANDPAPPETLGELIGETLVPALTGAVAVGVVAGLLTRRFGRGRIERALARWLVTALTLVEDPGNLRR